MLPGTQETEILKKQLDIAKEALKEISERCGPPENIAKYALEDMKGCVCPYCGIRLIHNDEQIQYELCLPCFTSNA